MNKHKKGSRFLLLAIISALGMLLGACGMDSPKGTTVQTKTGGTVSAPVVGMKTCTSCHKPQTYDWLTSKHANVDPVGNLYSRGNPTMGLIYTGGVITNPVTVPATCKNCHDPLLDSAQLVNSYTSASTGGATIKRPVVGCESCHGGGELHVAAGGAGPIGTAAISGTTISGTTSSLPVSAQFMTCTNCHELLDANDPVNTAATPTHAGISTYVITDTHFAKPGVWTQGTSTNENAGPDINGYAMNYNGEKVCSNCHNPHKSADINREWAASRHADKTYNRAWAEYNWSCDGTVSASCGTSSSTNKPTSRKSCQRCHTTTGYATFADALRAGNTTLAASITAGSYTIPNFFSTTWKPEMLQCSACHTDNRGSLRDPGAFKATYGGGITYQYDNLAGSNVCMLCHTGRNAGSSINILTNKFKTGRPMRDFETHYLPAAGTMFKSIGYEYAGRDYDNPTSYQHDKIGTPALPIDGGGNGPCVGCHMYRPGGTPNHLFSALKVTGGIITGITSDVCFNVTCHAGSNAMLTEIAEDEKVKFEYALEVFAVALATKPSYTFKPHTSNNNTDPYIPLSNIESPYFGAEVAGTANVVWDNTDDTGNTAGKYNAGAAYNFLTLHDEPGAYVHNSKYTKRLIYDSIDWLDDGSLNYSVGATLPSLTYSALTTTAKSEAAKYLLPSGSLWQGVYPAGYGLPSERP